MCSARLRLVEAEVEVEVEWKRVRLRLRLLLSFEISIRHISRFCFDFCGFNCNLQSTSDHIISAGETASTAQKSKIKNQKFDLRAVFSFVAASEVLQSTRK